MQSGAIVGQRRTATVVARILIALFALPAYVFILHWCAPLTTKAINSQTQTLGPALADIALWGTATAVGFGLFGVLATLRFPNRYAVVHFVPLGLIMIGAIGGAFVVFMLAQGAASLPDSPADAPRTLAAMLHRWTPYLFMPVTILILANTFVQRLSADPGMAGGVGLDYVSGRCRSS
jgi:hypothetical protein